MCQAGFKYLFLPPRNIEDRHLPEYIDNLNNKSKDFLIETISLVAECVFIPFRLCHEVVFILPRRIFLATIPSTAILDCNRPEDRKKIFGNEDISRSKIGRVFQVIKKSFFDEGINFIGHARDDAAVLRDKYLKKIHVNLCEEY